MLEVKNTLDVINGWLDIERKISYLEDIEITQNETQKEGGKKMNRDFCF